ncbi:hypothetical protein [Marinomonas sp. 2405UD68-3]|uniref:hypothetical protein n=1 Tax=Marinomonas sp. 2405UD68-3 TaxID=3391835 RepID=UPI0039C98C58
MFKQCAFGTVLCFIVSGCSSFDVIDDHREDYKLSKANTVALKYPEGSVQPIDVLRIPNEKSIDHVGEWDSIQIPKPPSVFHSLTSIHIEPTEIDYQLFIPANVSVTENILINFLTSLYGDGNPIRLNENGRIETKLLKASGKGQLASIWRWITQLPSTGTVLEFTLTEHNVGTKIQVRFREEKSDGEFSSWMSPTDSRFVESTVVRLWGVFGRQLSENTAFLSNQSMSNTTALWVDHKGHFVFRIQDRDMNKSIEELISSANLYLLSTSPNTLALKPESELPKIGDIVNLKIPFLNQELSSSSSIKGRRRNLDDVEWDEKIYNFNLDENTLGKFLVIDFTDVDYPELRSYQVMSRFIN